MRLPPRSDWQQLNTVLTAIGGPFLRALIHHELDGMNALFQLERKRLCRV